MTPEIVAGIPEGAMASVLAWVAFKVSKMEGKVEAMLVQIANVEAVGGCDACRGKMKKK